jgi:uncharacterized damage-inducible protein DinB
MTVISLGARILVVLTIAAVLGPHPLFGEEEAAPKGLANLAVFRLDSHLGDRAQLLANAIPAESYDWRPAEDVRSVAELFKHVASSYYWFGVELGAEKPADLTDWKQVETKEEILDALARSLDFVRQALQGVTEEELDQEIEFFGRQTTRRELVLNLMTHGSEHLGQAIAYSRSIGVAPPWSDG